MASYVFYIKENSYLPMGDLTLQIQYPSTQKNVNFKKHIIAPSICLIICRQV